MSQKTSPTVNDIVLQRIRFGLTRHENLKDCYPQELNYETFSDLRLNSMIHFLSWNLLGKEIETRTYPSTWWDAFKDRWFPKFLKQRFPVNWDEFKLYNICPHIKHEWPKNQLIHIHWLEKEHGFNIKRVAKNERWEISC